MTSFKSYVLKIFMLFTGCGLMLACTNDGENNVLDKQLQTGKSYYSLVYNKTFAKRFNLNFSDAVTLNDGLQAMAIEIRQTNYKYQCFLHLYIDDVVDIYTPVKGDYFSDKGFEEYFFSNNFNDSDQEWVSSQVFVNKMKIVYRETSLDTSENGLISTLSYTKMHRSFLPGLSVVAVKPFCSTLSKEHSPAQLWIQKNSVENYQLGDDDLFHPKQKQNNIVFDIPEKLIDMAAPYINIAIEKN